MRNEIKEQIELAEDNLNAILNNPSSTIGSLEYGIIETTVRLLKLSKCDLAWCNISDKLPPIGEEVLFFHEDWIDEDYNPKGIRIGFYEEDDFTTAKWWSIQDCYVTISHSECDNNQAYSEDTKKSIEPQMWKRII